MHQRIEHAVAQEGGEQPVETSFKKKQSCARFLFAAHILASSSKTNPPCPKLPKNFTWCLLGKDSLLEELEVRWSGSLNESTRERFPCIQLYFLCFKISVCLPKQFGQDTPVLNDSFAVLLLTDFMEDFGFHFSVFFYSTFT